MRHLFFALSSVAGHLGCFAVLAVVHLGEPDVALLASTLLNNLLTWVDILIMFYRWGNWDTEGWSDTARKCPSQDLNLGRLALSDWPLAIGLARSSFGFFHNIIQKTSNELFGQPNTTWNYLLCRAKLGIQTSSGLQTASVIMISEHPWGLCLWLGWRNTLPEHHWGLADR